MTTHYDLPKPSAIHTERSYALSVLLRDRILQHDGYISFADFMEQVLYHPQLGYYNREDFVLGKGGDFTTAPLVSPLFAHCFARQYRQFATAIGTNDILEIGAGSGHFAADLLVALQTMQTLPNHYYIYEIAPLLRLKQQHFLQQTCPSFYSRIIWLDELPRAFAGIVIANEVLDALPVHCFSLLDREPRERCVGIQNNQFAWRLEAPRHFALFEKMQELQFIYQFAPNYTSEINLSMLAFIKTLVESLERGVILFADYGYGQREYYHPERTQGTLTCFYQHRKHQDPFILPGLQDITAHVDFTSLIECAATLGCSLEGYTSQAAFLLNCGLLALANEEPTIDPIVSFQQQQAIKTLTLPTEMGERVKVMAIGKNLPASKKLPWLGFQFHNRSREL